MPRPHAPDPNNNPELTRDENRTLRDLLQRRFWHFEQHRPTVAHQAMYEMMLAVLSYLDCPDELSEICDQAVRDMPEL